MEHGNEVWEGNNAQLAFLESVFVGGAKCILGSSNTCNEAVRGLATVQCRRDKDKLKWS